jgi:hypothetical protein
MAFGKILRKDFVSRRDDNDHLQQGGLLHVPGPYGEWGDRKVPIGKSRIRA